VIYSATYWKFSVRIEDIFFPSDPHAEKTLAASRPPSTRRHTDSQSEAVSEGRCPCVRKNRARARARTCFTVSSARREPSAHGYVTSLLLVCASTIVATMHFLAAAIFCHRSRTQRRSVYMKFYRILSESF